MRWTTLLAEKRIAEEPATREEIRELWAVVRRDLKDASVRESSSDRRFNIAYDAARGLAKIAVRAEGYRVRSTGGEHYNTLLAMEVAIGDTPESEVDRLMSETEHLTRIVSEWLMSMHPELA